MHVQYLDVRFGVLKMHLECLFFRGPGLVPIPVSFKQRSVSLDFRIFRLVFLLGGSCEVLDKYQFFFGFSISGNSFRGVRGFLFENLFAW